MVFRLMKRAARWVVPTGAAVLVMSLAVPASFGQDVAFGKNKSCPPVYVAPSCPTAPAPTPAPTPTPTPTPQPEPTPAPGRRNPVDPLVFGATGGGESFAGAPERHRRRRQRHGPGLQRIKRLEDHRKRSPARNRIYFDYNYLQRSKDGPTSIATCPASADPAAMPGCAYPGVRRQ